MKKTLLTGTALATAALIAASPASAEIKIGAYMEWGIGFGDTDASGGGASRLGYATTTNTEVSFAGSGKTDAGIDYGFQFQLEGDAAGVDETSMYLSGAFGKVTLGSDDGAADAKIDGNVNGVAGKAGGQDAGLAGVHTTTTAVENNGLADGGDALMMMYETPTVGGVKAKVSLAPTSGSYQSLWGFNITSSFDLGDVGVTLNATGVHAGINATNSTNPTKQDALNGYNLGAALDFNGINFEVGYMRQHDGESQFSGDDDTAFVIGIGYGIDAWKVGIGYNASDENTSKDQFEAYSGGISYNIAKGLSVGGAVIFGNQTVTNVQNDYHEVTGTISMSF